jgi:hypothetical protein
MEAADRRGRQGLWRSQHGQPSSLFALAEFLRKRRDDLQRESAVGYALLRRMVARRCLEEIPELGPEVLPTSSRGSSNLSNAEVRRQT